METLPTENQSNAPRHAELKRLFPNASQSTLERNPHLSPSKLNKTNPRAILDGVQPYSAKMLMNKTESEFAQRLEIMKRSGEILRYEYEGITLRWAGIRYTPDFVVFQSLYVGNVNSSPQGQIVKLIEVKGPWIKGKFERAIERFRHARTYWPEFGFELWQKTKEGWIRKQ